MTHQLKKIGSDNFIQAAWDKSYFLSPNYTAQGWSIQDTLSEGNTVELYCPFEVTGSESFKKGSYYQIFSNFDLINPVSVFQLYDIQYQYLPNSAMQAKVYKLIGKSYRAIFSEPGIILNFNASKIKFKALMILILKQLNKGHPAFSLDETFIEDVNYTFNSFIAREYADKVFDEIQKYGFQLWWDANLKLHAISKNSNQVYSIDLDTDLKIKDSDFSYQNINAPVGQIIVVGQNVLSSNYLTENITADGTFDQKFYLTEKPGNTRRIPIDFDTQTIEELNNPSIVNGDSVENSRLTINNVSLQTFGSQYRNYKTSINCQGGITLGASLSLNQATGQCALLSLQNNPTDSVGEYLASFFIDNLKLKIIYNGQIIDPVFNLIPTLKRDITSITNNQVLVSDGLGYSVGQMVLFDISGEVLNTAIITSVVGNLITVDQNIQFVSGMRLYQQADYLIKYIYYPNQIIFYAKKGTDPNFTVLFTTDLSLNDFRFLQIYANQLHSLSLDFIDLTENITIQVSRNERPLDVAFEDSASRLQAEIQVYEDTTVSKWSLKFSALTNNDETVYDEVFIVTSVISTTVFELDFVTGLAIGKRILINKTARYITNITDKKITINSPLAGVTEFSQVYLSETLPAKDDILKIVYLPSRKIELPLCPTECISSEGKATQIINIESDNNLTIEEFYLRAELEKSLFCMPELSGQFTLLIEHDPKTKIGHMGIMSDIPYAGQKISLNTEFKPELDKAEGVITSVTISGMGNENMIKVDVSVGTPLNSLAYFLEQSNKRNSKQTILINENIPDKSFLCTISERISVSDNIPAFISRTGYSNKNGVYKNMANGIRRKEYTETTFSLSNTAKKNAKNGVHKVYTNGIL